MNIKTFLKRTDGTASVEFALWLPLLALILMFATDTSMLIHRQTLIYDATRDASRQIVTGTTDIATAEAQLMERLHRGNPSNNPYEAKITRKDNFIFAELSVPYADVTTFSHLFFGGTSRLSGSVVMWDAATAIAEANAAADEEEPTS